jgi:hypothetical protein
VNRIGRMLLIAALVLIWKSDRALSAGLPRSKVKEAAD